MRLVAVLIGRFGQLGVAVRDSFLQRLRRETGRAGKLFRAGARKNPFLKRRGQQMQQPLSKDQPAAAPRLGEQGFRKLCVICQFIGKPLSGAVDEQRPALPQRARNDQPASPVDGRLDDDFGHIGSGGPQLLRHRNAVALRRGGAYGIEAPQQSVVASAELVVGGKAPGGENHRAAGIQVPNPGRFRDHPADPAFLIGQQLGGAGAAKDFHPGPAHRAGQPVNEEFSHRLRVFGKMGALGRAARKLRQLFQRHPGLRKPVDYSGGIPRQRLEQPSLLRAGYGKAVREHFLKSVLDAGLLLHG